MAWYRTGTINLTNGANTVTATGTLFISNIKSGFALIGPDFSVYEIDNVSSDTSFTLRENYRGTTVTGASYAIFQTQGIIRALTDEVTELITTFGPLKDDLETNTLGLSSVLSGLDTSSTADVTSSDTVLSAFGKLQAKIGSVTSGIAATVRNTVLTGLSLATNAAITASDTVLSAFGKLQKQITDLTTTVSGKEPTIAAGTTSQYWRGDKTWQTFPTTSGNPVAWVNFNGTGTVAIRASLNVSSITDNGVGDYTVNFTTALTDANYAVNYTANHVSGTGYTMAGISTGTTPTASLVRLMSIQQLNGTTVTADTAYNCVSVFR